MVTLLSKGLEQKESSLSHGNKKKKNREENADTSTESTSDDLTLALD